MRLAPLTGFMVLAAAIAISGMPPFGLFRSEVLIVTGGFAKSSFFLAGLVILLANVAFVGLYRTFHRMVLSEAPEQPTERSRRPQQPLMAGAMVICFVALLLLGLWIPDPLNDLLRSATNVIGGQT
jgi:hydrogenase-4 component F